MKVLDTHLHLWDPSVLRYDWLIDVPPLHRPFAARELAEATADVPTDVSLKYIFMQAGAADEQALAEVDWVSGLAEHLPIAGIIAFAPVELGAGVGTHESLAHLDGGGLAGAVGAEQCEHLGALPIEVQTVDREG